MTTAGLGGPDSAHLRDTDAASLIAALHSRAEDIRRAELARAEGRWDALCPDDRRRVETLTQSIVGALLDEATARLQAETARDAGYLESARYLFGLEA
jgi:glutamyl-tRNA reductase